MTDRGVRLLSETPVSDCCFLVYDIKSIFSRFSELGQNWVYKMWSRKIHNDLSYELVYPDLFLHVELIAVEVESLK